MLSQETNAFVPFSLMCRIGLTLQWVVCNKVKSSSSTKGKTLENALQIV